ncbi:MAG: hypothetical protein V3W44_04265 [Dehalococcoidales bacterium]
MKKLIIYSLVWLFLCGSVFGAEIIRYVDTGSAAGGDGTTDALSGGNHAYQTQAVAISTEAQDLTDGGGDHFILKCNRTGGGGVDTTTYNLIGWTTGAANYIEIFGTDFPVDGIWDDSAYILHNNDAAVFCIDVDEEFVRFTNMQFQVTQGGASSRFGLLLSMAATGTSDYRISNCIIKGSSSGTGNTGGIGSSGTNINIDVWNTTIYGFVNGADASHWGIFITSGVSVEIYNTVIYGCYIGYTEAAASSMVKNCAIGNCTDDISTDDTVDYCCTDDGDGTNSTGPQGGSWANEYTDAANGDFTPLGGTGLSTAGVNDPGSGRFSTDIIGNSYVTDSWLRGAYAGLGVNGAQMYFVTKNYWKNFIQEGINGKWRMPA